MALIIVIIFLLYCALFPAPHSRCVMLSLAHKEYSLVLWCRVVVHHPPYTMLVMLVTPLVNGSGTVMYRTWLQQAFTWVGQRRCLAPSPARDPPVHASRPSHAFCVQHSARQHPSLPCALHLLEPCSYQPVSDSRQGVDLLLF